METCRIAIPSTMPGGMDSALGEHFGHCDCYTVVDVADGKIAQVGTLPNVPHMQGGCMAPVNHLSQNGVTVLVAGGMGMRPLMGFNQMGISVYFAGNQPTVGMAVQAFCQGKLTEFTPEHTCGGGH